MKKTILILGLCAGTLVPLAAQEQVDVVEVVETPSANALVVNKYGQAILPQAGDFALGIDAIPFLKFVGNAFNGKSDNDISFDYYNQTLYGKYFLKDNRAVRAQLMVNFYSRENKNFVSNDYILANDPLNVNASVADVRKINHQEMNLALGYEFRRGRGRLQGFYGGGVQFGYSKENIKYAWGNPITEVNQAPTSTSPTGSAWNTTTNLSARPTETKGGITLSGGVHGFVGVEYFVAPLISLGGEFDLILNVSGTNQSETTNEWYNSASGNVETTPSRLGSQGGSEIRFSPASYQGFLFIMFHF